MPGDFGEQHHADQEEVDVRALAGGRQRVRATAADRTATRSAAAPTTAQMNSGQFQRPHDHAERGERRRCPRSRLWVPPAIIRPLPAGDRAHAAAFDSACRRRRVSADGAKRSHSAIDPSAKPPRIRNIGRIAELLRDPAADRRAERGAKALHGHDRALADIDAAGAVQDAGDKAGHGDALQAGADAVEDLHGIDAPFVR